MKSRSWTFVVTDTVFTGGDVTIKDHVFPTKELAEAAAVEFALSHPVAVGNVSVIEGEKVRFKRCSFVGVSINFLVEVVGDDVIFMNQ